MGHEDHEGPDKRTEVCDQDGVPGPFAGHQLLQVSVKHLRETFDIRGILQRYTRSLRAHIPEEEWLSLPSICPLPRSQALLGRNIKYHLFKENNSLKLREIGSFIHCSFDVW